MIFNIVFHLFDFLAEISYAIEDGMDGGYYQMGEAAG